MNVLAKRPALLACAIAIAAAAHAAEPAKPGAKPAAAKPAREGGFGAKATGPLLTRGELRTCLETQERVRTQTEEASRMRTELDAQKAELQQSGDALKAELAAVDRTKQEDVDAYNARVADRGQRIAAYDQAIQAFNARVDALTADREVFTRDCSNRRYDEADEIKLRSGR